MVVKDENVLITRNYVNLNQDAVCITNLKVTIATKTPQP